MICPQYLTRGLEQVFERVQRERMQGIPVLNPALKVQGVGFESWGDHCLGVLITPWFMNLVLLPHEGETWTDLSIGDKVEQVFPSGAYEFIVGEEPGAGRYLMCSLFSPMFEFADQQAAVATATAALQGLMEKENHAPVSMREKEIERIWRGESEEDEPGGEDVADGPTLSERLEQPISRRDLLRGRVAGSSSGQST